MTGGSTPAILAGQAAARHGTRLALRYGERTWTFAAFEAIVRRLAGDLARDFDRGARVVIVMANRPEMLFLQVACERAGLVRVPVNVKTTAYELGLIVEDCEAAAVFHDARTTAVLAAIAAKLGSARLVSVDDTAIAETGIPAGPARPPDERARPEPGLDDLCSINYTSGTSGRPKGVMLSHRNWAAVYRNMLVDRDIRPEDVLAHIAPLSHSSGAYFMPFFLRGAANLILEESTVEGLFAAIAAYKVTAFNCVPTLLTRIVNHEQRERHDLSSLRVISYGAEPIPQNTYDRALAIFGPILVQNYGQTEAMMTCAVMPCGEAPDGELNGCIGRPYTFVEIVLRSPDGALVPPGEIGEITVRSDHVMMGYWNMPAETAKVLRGGWLWTGDLAATDDAGRISLRGRSKDMLISGGFNIYPQEVEARLTACSGVREAAVFGVADPNWGEVAVGVVSLVPGAASEPRAILAEAKRYLGIKTPKQLIVMDDLPKTANGKINKAALKESFLQRAQR